MKEIMTVQERHDYEAILKFMNEMGFMETESKLIFWHMYFGENYKFDMSASGSKKWAIMQNVFVRATEFGEAKRLKEIQLALGMTKE